ncbi:MAG: nucleotidyltransferase family protein [Nitrosopumilus sp. B06]|nr:MAG: nucleotidyltransferase family protein [Nitrosopumilus sp. B06]
MKAIILAGGRGKRLRPITDYVPKPLVPIRNIPIIEWQLRYLKKHGIMQAVICTSYKTEQLEDYLARNARINVTLSVEKTPLGTAGAIKKAARTIKDDSFIVINGDVITDINIKKMLKTPNSVAAVPLRTQFGVLDVNNNMITRFGEKKDIPDMWMNAGIYHLQKSAIRDLPAKGDIERTFFPKYAKSGKLAIVKFNRARWHSMDSFKDIEECSAQIGKMNF